MTKLCLVAADSHCWRLAIQMGLLITTAAGVFVAWLAGTILGGIRLGSISPRPKPTGRYIG